MTPVARTPSPARTCWTRDRESSRTALPLFLSPGVFGRRQGCDLASGALCRDRHSPSAVSRKGRAPITRSASTAASSKASASPDQSAFHRRRPSSTSLFSRDPLARACFREASGGCPPTSAIECDPRARPRTDRTPTPCSTGWRLPLRDTPAEVPRIRDPARGSHRAGRRHRARASKPDRTRWTGRPQSASTRAPSVANP
jgi:hypothetical protein